MTFLKAAKVVARTILLGGLALSPLLTSAQLSLTSAVDLALRNSPRVKMAQADLDKATAALAEAHNAYVPAVVTSGGYGSSTGVPTSLPVVFSINAQSLVFNFSQKDYVRAAGAAVLAAQLALEDARNEAAEDTVTTYVTLNNALLRKAALAQSAGIADRLIRIVQDRFEGGLEPKRETIQARRTATQVKLQQLLVEDEIAFRTEHLARLTGVSGPKTETLPDSIPVFIAPGEATGSLDDSPGIRSAYMNAKAKSFQALGDARYRLRPQIGFFAGYSRISTVGSSYGDYYPRFANNTFSHNSLDIGVSISVPVIDLVHQAKARGSAAEARRVLFEADSVRNSFLEARAKLQHVSAELAARAELASLDREIAQDQLDTVRVQLQAAAANPDAPQMSPKDEQNAMLQERQKYVDFLDAELQLRQTQVNLLRQNGQLGAWLRPSLTTPSTLPTPSAPPPGTSPRQPSGATTPALPVQHP